MKITLGSRELRLTSASVLKIMDKGTDEWNAVVEWTPGNDQEFDELAAPRSLAESVVSINDEVLITGNKYVTAPSLTNKGSQLGLGGFSKTISLIISNPKVQKTFYNSSLLDISTEFCDLFNISALFQDVEIDLVNEIFTEPPRVKAQQKIFAFLQDLARQRGFLTSSDEFGNLLYLGN